MPRRPSRWPSLRWSLGGLLAGLHWRSCASSAARRCALAPAPLSALRRAGCRAADRDRAGADLRLPASATAEARGLHHLRRLPARAPLPPAPGSSSRPGGAQVGQFVLVFFLPIFFTYTGLRTNVLGLVTMQDWLVVRRDPRCRRSLSKVVPVHLAARAAGMRPPSAVADPRCADEHPRADGARSCSTSATRSASSRSRSSPCW